MILTGSVILGGLVQEGASQTRVRHESVCQSFRVVKTFSLRDPTTNEHCTLKIPTKVCGGFCLSETEIISKIDPQSNAYRLSPVTKCRCCEPTHQPPLHIFPAGSFRCTEGQKWNQSLKFRLPINNCHCRTCTSSATVN